MIWLALLFSLSAAFLLSGISTALLNVSRVRARHAAEEGDSSAARLAALLEHRNELHPVVAALTQAFSTVAFVCLGILPVEWLGAWGWAAAVLLALPVFLVGLEFVPKALFLRYPFRLLRRLATPLTILHVMAKPWLWLMKLTGQRASGDSSSNGDIHGLQVLAQTVATLGVLPQPICALVQRSATFQTLHAAGIMIPLTEITALPHDMPLASAVTLNGRPMHPWRAVLGPDGTLQGWLDMTALPTKPSMDKLVRQFMRPILPLRGTDPALRCLQALRKRGEPVAAVLDAKGDALGVVTQQALIAELLQI